ncbi:UDP-glucose 4-epimerase [Pseudomonas protegens Cab57]|uniref:UDP-glucose 4-epimerase GalE n=1 Tax=Pseudomonas protegens TaxID=380021 RepID=UPI00044248ED|nr:UDP-glucose 4-epimerase GalE [Pseudomonas protegens]BAO64721.1 UDP-glucose 4-epimerase [Pseudomonas protegens Cab57]
MRFLITGGAGYIGSHTLLELLQAGHEAVVLDNLCNSSMLSLQRVQQITGVAPVFVQGDVCDRAVLDRIFTQYEIDGVLHFAGLKAVGESVKQPLSYYQNNVSGSITLCQAMATAGVYRLVFSSSATVYGDPVQIPLVESSPLGTPTNPYGTSKLMVEKMLQDMATADPRWSVALLRYFNPVGAHQSGLMGEDPNGLLENLLPYISRVAVGKLERLSIYGNDYPTPDGTGVRDYIHVVDLAKGHIAAVNYISQHTGINAWNLGTGVGYSVLEMIRAFEDASGCTIPYTLSPRRQGDIAQCWSDPSKALHDLGWKAERGLKEMMEDTWRWQSNNPDGYRSFE